MCPFTVRVTLRYSLADFLGSTITCAISSARVLLSTIGLQLYGWICLPHIIPKPFNGLFRQSATVSQLRLHITRKVSSGILTASAIAFGFSLTLRTRLTQGRLTSPWKPWSFGEGESHSLYRYLYLHLLFHTLQSSSRCAFCAEWNAPLPILTGFHSFGTWLHTRLLSMPSSSTSELLRTL